MGYDHEDIERLVGLPADLIEEVRPSGECPCGIYVWFKCGCEAEIHPYHHERREGESTFGLDWCRACKSWHSIGNNVSYYPYECREGH